MVLIAEGLNWGEDFTVTFFGTQAIGPGDSTHHQHRLHAQ